MKRCFCRPRSKRQCRAVSCSMLDRSFYNADPLTKNVWYAKLTTEKLINLDVIITHQNIPDNAVCMWARGIPLGTPSSGLALEDGDCLGGSTFRFSKPLVQTLISQRRGHQATEVSIIQHFCIALKKCAKKKLYHTHAYYTDCSHIGGLRICTEPWTLRRGWWSPSWSSGAIQCPLRMLPWPEIACKALV